ncbi:MAG: glycoside hydrolase family 3 C-terminal domain-containing protein [Bacillales bacterium]|nr:glycoside hydrolase family 3 C-terminal domain-containing protein [Bacillales bacterium]
MENKKMFFSTPKRKKVFAGCFLSLIAIIGVALGVGNYIAFERYPTVISGFLCPNGDKTSSEANNARNMGNQLAREIEREGIVMVKNDGTLPLSKSISKVNVFGHGSVDWYIMSSGSERVGTEGQTCYGINEALEEYGIKINKEIPEFYLKWHKAEGDSNTIMASFDGFYQVREPSLEDLSEYQAIYERAKDFSQTAFFVVSRHAGENSDPPHYQNKVEGQPKDETRGYLEISTEEEYAIRKLGEDFENVVVIINSTNTMTLDFVEKIPGVDACISVGATGVQGALSIPEILWGDASPSGRLTDTIPYRPEYNITYYRSCAKFTHQYINAPDNCTMMGAGGSSFYRTSCYVEYTEGIYVGYRWFETADIEGFWDNSLYNGYENVVQYPFGYGLSYTTFDWKLEDTSIAPGTNITNESKIVLTIQVENTGKVTGKDVVEVYLTAPYTPGGIEKSYVKLVGFAKTPELRPGQKANVEIEIDAKEFKSYDYNDANGNGFKGYELEAGDYELKIMSNAHTLKEGMNNNIVTYHVVEDICIENDEKTGTKVRNLFTGEDAYESISIDGSDVGQNVEYVHRNEFPALLTEVEPNKPWTNDLLRRSNGRTAPRSVFTREMADAWDNATGLDVLGREINTEMPIWDSKATNHKLIEKGELTELGTKLAADYDAPEWEEVLNQVPFEHAKHILTMDTSYKAPGIEAIGLRTNDDGAYQHAEGASQVGNGHMAPGTSCVGYPGSTVLAQTWNQVLAYMFGKSEGNDMGPAGKDALYSPACNIHRSNYGGRNSGYQSEDPFLSGRMVANVVRGLGVYGKTTFVKHFVVNDQDFNRMALYTWCNEQALREIYLRTFEETVKYGDTTGIMTSFNRLGAIWTGGNEALIQGVLRGEWGFRGQIITDMTENKTHMDIGAGLRAGGNINLGGGNSAGATLSTSSPARLQNRMREAIKQIAYSYTHALYKNKTYNESADPADAVIVYESKQSWQWWKPGLVSLDAVVFGGLGIWAFIILKNGLGLFKKKED